MSKKMLLKKVRKVLNKGYRTIKTIKDKITKKIITMTKAKDVLYDLDYKVPIHTVRRYGYTFHIKDVDAIVSGDKAALVVSEVAAVYRTSKRGYLKSLVIELNNLY